MFQNYRLPKGQKWEDDVIEILEQRGYTIKKHGYEHTHTEILSLLINCNDSTAKFIRYQPDHIAIKDDKVFFFEPKKGDAIEKDAYQIYFNLFKIGCDITLFIKEDNNNIYEIPIQELKLISGKEKVESFPNHWIKVPTDENDWIAPRLLEKSKYNQWKRITKGSGTSHRYFDFKNMKEYKLDFIKSEEVF